MNQTSDFDALFTKLLTCLQAHQGRFAVCVSDDTQESFAPTDPDQVNKLKVRFLQGRAPQAPSLPQTSADPALLRVMQQSFESAEDAAVVDAMRWQPSALWM